MWQFIGREGLKKIGGLGDERLRDGASYYILMKAYKDKPFCLEYCVLNSSQ